MVTNQCQIHLSIVSNQYIKDAQQVQKLMILPWLGLSLVDLQTKVSKLNFLSSIVYLYDNIIYIDIDPKDYTNYNFISSRLKETIRNKANKK